MRPTARMSFGRIKRDLPRSGTAGRPPPLPASGRGCRAGGDLRMFAMNTVSRGRPMASSMALSSCPARAHEGLALPVFFGAGRFADDQPVRAPVADAEHGLGACAVQRALGAAGTFAQVAAIGLAVARPTGLRQATITAQARQRRALAGAARRATLRRVRCGTHTSMPIACRYSMPARRPSRYPGRWRAAARTARRTRAAPATCTGADSA